MLNTDLISARYGLYTLGRLLSNDSFALQYCFSNICLCRECFHTETKYFGFIYPAQSPAKAFNRTANLLEDSVWVSQCASPRCEGAQVHGGAAPARGDNERSTQRVHIGRRSGTGRSPRRPMFGFRMKPIVSGNCLNNLVLNLQVILMPLFWRPNQTLYIYFC